MCACHACNCNAATSGICDVAARASAMQTLCELSTMTQSFPAAHVLWHRSARGRCNVPPLAEPELAMLPAHQCQQQGNVLTVVMGHSHGPIWLQLQGLFRCLWPHYLRQCLAMRSRNCVRSQPNYAANAASCSMQRVGCSVVRHSQCLGQAIVFLSHEWVSWTTDDCRHN